MKRIVLTGGGTAGHVTPNLALIPILKQKGYEIHYIGTKDGMERGLVEKENLPYHHIPAGKLRRYFDVKNATDTVRILGGYFRALVILRKIKPQVVFSKGGFVTCPVVWAARTLGIPVLVHESDISPGLANKLCLPFANKILYTFPETDKYLPADKRVLAGLPIRAGLLSGSAQKGREICGFDDKKPVLLVMGGSLGAGVINTQVRDHLTALLDQFQICHLCGKGNVDESLNGFTGYYQTEYAHETLPHLMKMADVFLSRAGATAIHEMLLMKKPMVLIPLSKNASRGDQILNAISFEHRGFASVLFEEDLEPSLIVGRLMQVWYEKKKYIDAMEKAGVENGISRVAKMIENLE